MSTAPCIDMHNSEEDDQLSLGVYPRYHAQLDPYRTLGVPPNASMSEIKLAFRKLAVRCHPDKVQGDDKVKARAHDIFANLSAAYELLTRSAEAPTQFLGTAQPTGFASNHCSPQGIFTSPNELFQQQTHGPHTCYHMDDNGLFNAWKRYEENCGLYANANGGVAGLLTNGHTPTDHQATSSPMLITHQTPAQIEAKRHLDNISVIEPQHKRQRMQHSMHQTNNWGHSSALKRNTSHAYAWDGKFYCPEPKRVRVAC